MKVKVEEAVGTVLAHDLTQVISESFKGARYKKGYIIQEKDIDILKSMGKYHLNIIQMNEDELHEDEAAKRLAEACMGKGLYQTEPAEAKVQIKASQKGLLKINIEALMEINEIEGIILSTCHTNTVVQKDQLVAGTKVIPLIIQKDKIEQAESLCQNEQPVIEVIPLKALKVGILVTGSEVYYKIIEDKFGAVLRDKAVALGGEVVNTLYAPDDIQRIKQCILELMSQGAELIMVSGGMAVDADDLTPTAIREIADGVITYGSPVLPGAMFMLAYAHKKGKEEIRVPLLGVPACGMYRKITVLDLVLPRLFAEEEVTKRDMLAMAHGGFCYGCSECRYPICPMGK
ncbi:MAG: molybdopterin binding protein [Clostridia bacterium]|nr:molybdopterin binding protein [Clostridia bacterium]